MTGTIEIGKPVACGAQVYEVAIRVRTQGATSAGIVATRLLMEATSAGLTHIPRDYQGPCNPLTHPTKGEPS